MNYTYYLNDIIEKAINKEMLYLISNTIYEAIKEEYINEPLFKLLLFCLDVS